MAAEFVSLADWLTPASATASSAAVTPPEAGTSERATVLPDDSEVAAGDQRLAFVAEALRDARLFRARLADAFAETSARLLRELACDVLARELRLAPCDLAALMARALERVPVVRVRVAPADRARIAGVPVVADPALRSGDAVVELAGGALDARLGVRLTAVLEAFT